MSRRSFMWRWSWRLFRKELRQHLVILVMLTLGVAVAVGGVLSVHNLVFPPAGEYGNGSVAISSSNDAELVAQLDAANIQYGALFESDVERDGQVGVVRLKSADPDNSITGVLFDLVEGRWPTGDDEIAVTDRALADRPGLGAVLSLGGQSVHIVGVVENPNDLSDEFVFTGSPEGFEALTADPRRYLMDISADELDRIITVPFSAAESGGPSDRTVLGIIVNVIVAFGMLEIALLVGAAFAVIARRRTRQYALVASAGASPAMVRSAAATSGAIVGLIGTVLGFALGGAIALLLVPAMETSVDHRISFDVPVVTLLPSLVLGIGVAILGARRAASSLTRSSIASLLSSARPKPEPVGASTIVGAVLAVLGTALLVMGFGNLSLAMAMGGAVLAPVGLLLLAPLLVKALGVVAARLPLSERLAGRSIARYNRRSASLVAALALALAVPVGIAVASGSVDQRAQNRPPNLNDNQLLLWAPDASPGRSVVPASIDQAALGRARDSVAAVAPELSFTPLQVVVRTPEASYSEEGVDWNFPLVAGELWTGEECAFCSMDTIGFGDGPDFIASIAYLATPELLAALDLETDWLEEGKGALARTSGVSLLGNDVLADGSEVAVSDRWPNISSFADLVYSPEFAEGFPVTTVAWLATSDAPIASETLSAISGTNLGGVSLELAAPPEPRSALRALGLLIGSLVGLAITAAGVVLLSAELAPESALLASLGASPATGRRRSAAIAGFLAFSGALLAVLVGYLPLAPMMSSSLDEFPFVVPWASILPLLIAFPLAAAGLGWLLSRKAAAGLDLRDFV